MEEREFGQAKNLYDRIKTKTGIEKTIVLAGYWHIAKTYKSYTAMGMYFKKISGIDPLAIDQTMLLEEFRDSPYAHKLMSTRLTRDSVFAFTAKEANLSFGLNATAFDIYVYNPPTSYFHNRPNWLLTSSDKYFVSIEIPKSIKPVLVQAYSVNEITSDTDFKIKIPCDQTFYSENNYAWLTLRKGKEYIIIYRDDKNRIVFKKVIKT